MMSLLLAGAFALAFIALVDRCNKATRVRRSSQSALVVIAAMVAAIALVTPAAHAAERIAEGTLVRMESAYIEAGWHEGALRRAPNQCWMVYLSKPTKDKYTLLALTTAKRLQVSRNGQWLEMTTRANLTDQPRECLEDGAD